MALIALALSLLFSPLASGAESVGVYSFGGLNNAVDSSVIGQAQCQDCSNVEVNKEGNGIRKRGGYTEFLNLSNSAASVTTALTFKNSNGDECSIYVASGTVYRSINGATAVQVTTITPTARLWCTPNNGVATCFSSANDVPFSDNCVTHTLRNTGGYPRGTANAFTQDRQLVAGTTDFPNRLHLSKSGDFNTFTTGNDAIDAWTEDIGTGGDKIVGVSYLNGRILVWKETSIIGFNCTDQFNCPAYDVTNNAGITSPEAMVTYKGYAYFKASDNEFYATDGTPGNLEKISTEISSTTAALLTGKTRSNIQTNKDDFDSGNLTFNGPGAPMRTDIITGSVMPSSNTLVDTSSSNFAAGTLGSSLTVTSVDGSIQVSTTISPIYNGTFETGNLTYWTCTKTRSDDNCGVTPAAAISGVYGATVTAAVCLPTADTTIRILDVNDVILYSKNWTSDAISLVSGSVDLAALGLSTQALKIAFYAYGGAGAGSDSLLTSSTFTAVSSITWTGVAGGCNSQQWSKLDDVRVNRYFDQSQSSQTYTFTSQIFNTQFSTPIGGTLTASSVTPVGTSLSYQVRSASSTSGVWTAWTNTTNLGRITQAKQYWQYVSSFTTNVGTSTPRLDDVSLVAATTGTFVTQCLNTTPINSWGTLEAAGSLSQGSFVFYNSTGTSCSDVGSSWAAVSTGTTITISTTSAYKVRVDFGLNSATNTARLDSITVNWTEGSVAPPSYATYWNDALYFAVADAGTTNNKTLKYDLLYKQWFPFDIPMNAPYSYNNIFYFGCVNCGKVYKYSNIKYSQAPTSDAGSNINSYFRTKAFSGTDPHLENTYENISLIFRKQSGGTVNATWRLNGGSSGSDTFSVNLSTGDNVVRHNESFPIGQKGTFFDLEFGNNSTYPWEVLGFKVEFSPEPWRQLP